MLAHLKKLESLLAVAPLVVVAAVVASVAAGVGAEGERPGELVQCLTFTLIRVCLG